nr:hypothetical protein [Treponema pedis]
MPAPEARAALISRARESGGRLSSESAKTVYVPLACKQAVRRASTSPKFLRCSRMRTEPPDEARIFL